MTMRIDNSIPLMVGEIYQLGNKLSGNWVRIIAIENGMVYAIGVDNTIADLRVPDWKFDDLLAYPPRALDIPYYLMSHNSFNLLLPNDEPIIVNWEAD